MLAAAIVVPLFIGLVLLMDLLFTPQDSAKRARPRNVSITTLEPIRPGQAYVQTLRIVDTKQPTYALIDGELPSGLALTKEGVIHGTLAPAATTKDYEFSVRVLAKPGAAWRWRQAPRYWFRITVVTD